MKYLYINIIIHSNQYVFLNNLISAQHPHHTTLLGGKAEVPFGYLDD